MLSNRSHLIVPAVLGLALALSLGGPARAGYVVNVTESGGNVVATGSGTIDTTDLTSAGGGFSFPQFGAGSDIALFGPVPGPTAELFSGLSGPSSFGTGSDIAATADSGNFVGFFASGTTLWVPQNYVSGSQLSSSDVWSGQTFSSLGLTTGTYVWTWGSGAHADSFTMNIGVSSVPEPASLVLFGTGALAILGYSRRKGAVKPKMGRTRKKGRNV